MNNTVENVYSKEDKWLLSPIVGEVTNLSAVIIFEPHEPLPISYLVLDGKNIILKEIVEVIENGPTRVVLNFPQSENYVIEWYQKDTIIFRHTIQVGKKITHMIFVSCDLLEAETSLENSMWTKMFKECSSDRNICLFHNGDQAYMDAVFNDCLDHVKRYGKNNDTAKYVIRKYGLRYYDTWRNHFNLLAQVANYNIWDDHEIKNNMTLTEDGLSEDEEYIRDLAVEAYKIYQESQHLNKTTIMSEYSWYKIIDNILVIGIERTSKIIESKEIIKGIYDLTSSLCEVDVKRIILCFSSAPIPPPQGGYGGIYRKLTGDKGTLETSKFWESDELLNLYQGLFLWMDSNIHRNREVIIVGGDLHFGTHGILKYKQMEIPVIVSSPITNQPTTDRWLASKGMKGEHFIYKDTLGNDMIFETQSTKARRCYSIIDLTNDKINVEMKYSTVKLPDSSLKYVKTLISFI